MPEMNCLRYRQPQMFIFLGILIDWRSSYSFAGGEAVVLQSHTAVTNLYSCMADNPSRAAKHLFSLVRLRADCAITPTLADFAPTFPNTPNGPAPSATPNFNHDRCFYTPAFILPQQKAQGNWTAEKLQFQHRLRVAEDECAEDGVVEEVAPSSNYCQICQEHFRSYHEHLAQKGHMLRWEHNQFNLDIRALCLKREEASCPLPKRKPITKKPRRPRTPQLSPKTTVESGPKKLEGTDVDSPKSDWDKSSFKL